MLTADTIDTLRRWRAGVAGPVGLVPTMGALHAGHLSLVDAARAASAAVVVSIFVNPLQFGPGEDLDAYPRDLGGDLEQLRAAGVDAVFAPTVADFVPDDLATTVTVARLTDGLEGASRPGHFAGVTTIVTKLLHVVAPDLALFGEKDYQQLAVIRRMVADLDLPVEIVARPIVRDADGLALSSRNVRLSRDERTRALRLSGALRAAAAGWDGDADAARATLAAKLRDGDGIAVDYAEVVDPDTLVPLAGGGHPRARALVAARVGATRLIDNVLLALPDAQELHSSSGAHRATRNGAGKVSSPGGAGAAPDPHAHARTAPRAPHTTDGSTTGAGEDR